MIKVVQKNQDEEESQKALLTKKILFKMRHESEEEQTAALAAAFNFPYMDTNLVPISNDSLRLLDEASSKKYHLAFVQKIAKQATAVSSSPENPETQKFIAQLCEEKGWKIKVFMISRYNMERIWERYKKIVFVDFLDELSVNLTGENLSRFEEELKELLSLKQRIDELSTTQIIGVVMSGAYKLNASDIHIEPQEKEIRLRYRIDGVLQDIAYLPLKAYKPVLTRIKVISGMKINLRDIAQDGTFEINLTKENGKKKIDTRVSVIPGNFGESIVIRLLDPESIAVEVDKLGLQGLAHEEVQRQSGAPNGMILSTGPTGSGKTTSLYSILGKLNTSDKKIITIEDPIEYELKGISQTQVEKLRGYTFANGLRSIVRQDPDIILVGEIRDDETADIAINAALTGHLVLTSLHTNNACGTIPRLIEMGVKPSLISPAINAAIGQRLVRRLCPHCKEEYIPAKESVEAIKKIISIISPKAKVEIPKKVEKLYRPKGCPECNNLGYKGRVGIFEVLVMSDEIERLTLELAGETEFTIAALEQGMITMLQDGMLKALSGVTSIDEVKRVTGQGDFLEEVYERLMAQALGRGTLVKKEHFEKAKTAIHDFKEFQKVIQEGKSTDINEYAFAAAQLLRVGDIHIEPGEQTFKIRFRIDGLLQDVAELPLTEFQSVLGKIKMLSGVKTEVRSGVIDSRFNIRFDEDIDEVKEKLIDVRVSIILGGYGETVVMRLLSHSTVDLELDKLGIRPENLEKIKHEIKKPNGIILNTGPTGSGKTSTLYSILNYLKNPELKIISVEDPIEYHIEGVLQTPVNDKDGYTFPTALRALLRQNPDVMMIGEIRDDETGQVAVQASLTGHLVLSTIHTNDAAGAVQRMANMGVSTSDIASSVNAFMAQRLVRVLCNCKKERQATPEEQEKIEKTIAKINPAVKIKLPKNKTKVCDPVGCDQCNHIGYRSRVPVSEVLLMTREMQELITKGAITAEVRDEAIKEGMLTMAQDGILKVLEGETTIAEVERVTDL